MSQLRDNRKASRHPPLLLDMSSIGQHKGFLLLHFSDIMYSMTYSMGMNLSKFQETARKGKPSMLQSMGSQRIRHDLVTEQQL